MTSETARRLFSERVLPHLDDAYGLARWLTGDRADAEDVTQEACLRALAAIERAQTTNSRAWFLAVVRNAAFTWMARNRPQRVIVTDDIEAYADCADQLQAVSPETMMIAKADSAAIERAIDGLPLPFREALVMREFNDLSYREIAEATGAPIGTVMSRISRARNLLAAALKEASE